MNRKETENTPLDNYENKSGSKHSLILHNDDVHSFEYVIDALVDICQHNYEQAVQCTLITHHKGSCHIRKGDFKLLKKMKDSLTLKELNVTIN